MYIPSWPGLSPRVWFHTGAATELPFPFSAACKTYFHLARSGIYHLFRALGFRNGETVLVPDYHSGVELWAIRAAGASPQYYHINRNLEPDLDELVRLSTSGCRALYIIHFLGWPQPVQELRAFCRERGMILVEDCALSLYSEAHGQPLGTFGDYAVFCLYKTLPLPSGGLLIQNGDALTDLAELALKPCGMASVAGRTADLTLEWVRGRANSVGKAFLALKRGAGRALDALGVTRVPAGDLTPGFDSAGFDLAHMNTGMPLLCHRLLAQFDFEDIRRRRRANFLRLRARLDGRVALLDKDLEAGVCPLFFPILVPDKRSAAHALSRRGIEAVEFWNFGDPEARGPAYSEAQFLRDHLLELPIHQDVTPDQVEYIADQVLRLHLQF